MVSLMLPFICTFPIHLTMSWDNVNLSVVMYFPLLSHKGAQMPFPPLPF